MKKRETTTVRIKIPKPKLFAQESKYDVKEISNRKIIQEKISHRLFSSSPKKKCILPENARTQGKPFERETFVSYRLYDKNLGKIKRMQKAAIKIENKYKIEYEELRHRLHVGDPIDDVKTITDIDERFFKYLTNHGRTSYVPLYKSLRYIWNTQMQLKQDIGYRRDAVLKIEVTNSKELQVYNRSVKEYTEKVKQFDTFISEDYAKSIKILRRSEKLFSSKIVSTLLELEYIANLQCVTQSQLLSIDYLYHTQQKYGRFLYYLSPPSWRAKHRDFAHSLEIEAKGFDLGVSIEEDNFQVIFDKLRNECVTGLIKPVLYFTHPSEVATILETLAKQQVHHFTHVISLRPVTDQLKDEIKYLKLCIKKDTDFLANVIEDIEKLILFNEERACQLKSKFIKILHGLFFDNVAGTDALIVKMNLDWCLERIFMEKSTISLGNTAKAMEDMYMKYTYDLESISNEEITKALKLSIAEEKDIIHKAKEAAKELRLFNRLEKSLSRAFDMKSDKVNVAPVARIKRSAARKLKEIQIKDAGTARRSSQRVLSEAEIEYLTLFTNWTENEDPAKYLKSY